LHGDCALIGCGPVLSAASVIDLPAQAKHPQYFDALSMPTVELTGCCEMPYTKPQVDSLRVLSVDQAGMKHEVQSVWI
jgi:hypothetical protein